MKKKSLIVINIILICLFGCLTILVKYDLTLKFDLFCYNLITYKITPQRTLFYKFFTFFGSTFFTIVATILLLLVYKGKSRGRDFLLIILVGIALNSLLKVIILRPRPDVLKLVYESTYSYPSGHTMASFTLFNYLNYLIIKEKGRIGKNKKIFLISLLSLIAFFVAISRIYLGAHYATDVIAAIIFSTFVLINFLYFFNKRNNYSPTNNK